MLAPAFETLLDPPSAEHFDLFSAARAAWPVFADSIALPLERSGAIWAGADPGAIEAKLAAIGARGKRISLAEAEAALPGLQVAADEAVFTPEDWRIDAAMGLLALRTAAITAGARIVSQAVTAFKPGEVELADGRRIEADRLVLAVGAARPDLAPELASLTPVKGHILRYAAGPRTGPVVRAEGIYLRPHATGVVAGATMEVGRDDLLVDDAVVRGLAARATALFPVLEGAPHQVSVGVRATTADGLPLVGPSQAPGVLLAIGARRNGWLLAPAVAELVAALALGRSPGPFAAAFDPERLRAR
ncbi:MAG: hypothetical protein BGN86_10420 [Caulobacterales bacterium 68-7]|nr:MAG: hypothetical protein BGN86_10420 [Caulobacterales bacterium 68-7]